jgi:two-component sensor histidine kinase
MTLSDDHGSYSPSPPAGDSDPQRVSVQELHHRIKNVLAMAMAITSQSLARAKSLVEARSAIEQRLMALAETHNVLCDSGADGTTLRRIVNGAIMPYDTAPSRFTITGCEVPLSSRAALAAAMALHELATNAVRHGALSAEDGRVDITWRVDAPESRLHLTWRERGGPGVQEPTARGFGTRVIEASFRDQLGAEFALKFEPSGLLCTVAAPLSALRTGFA